MGSGLSQVKVRSVLAVMKNSLETHRKDLSAENEVRYKLIIDSSEDESVIRFLFSFGILQRKTTRVYFCSKFPGDGEAQKVCYSSRDEPIHNNYTIFTGMYVYSV